MLGWKWTRGETWNPCRALVYDERPGMLDRRLSHPRAREREPSPGGSLCRRTFRTTPRDLKRLTKSRFSRRNSSLNSNPAQNPTAKPWCAPIRTWPIDSRRLALVEMIYRVGLAPGVDRTIVAQTRETPSGASRPSSQLTSRARRLAKSRPLRPPGRPTRPPLGHGRRGGWVDMRCLRRSPAAAWGPCSRGATPDLGRDLAVKVLREDHRGQPRPGPAVRRGGADRRPAAAPRHRAGLRAGRRFGDGRPFFAMKLVKGRTLATLLGGPAATRPTDLPRFLAHLRAGLPDGGLRPRRAA